MNLEASDATHWCQIDGTFIFLDLSCDRYSMLQQSAADRFCQIIGGTHKEGDCDWLSARGLRNLALPTDRSSSGAMAPTCSLLEKPDLEQASAVDTARAIWALATVRRQVRRRPLGQVLQTIPRVVSAPMRIQGSDARQAAAAFKRARHYFSGLDECLSRGVAMRRVLAGKGCEARLVIGVTLPFAAHCWVQWGSAVLTDPLDVVTPYTPILVA